MSRFLTDKGIEYLREYLNVPPEVVPATLKKSARPAGERVRPMGGPRGDRPPREGGFREGYRSERREGGGFGRGGDRGDKVGWGAGQEFAGEGSGGVGFIGTLLGAGVLWDDDMTVE